MISLISKSKKQDKFLNGLLEYYNDFIFSVSTSVQKLSELQKKYPDKYKEFLEMQKDPSNLFQVAKDLDSDRSAILFFMLAKIQVLQSKLMHVFELDYKQQKELSNELKEFNKEFNKNLDKLKKLKEE